MSISRWARWKNPSSDSFQKGQAAIEFIIIFTILVVILIVVVYNSQLTVNDLNSERLERGRTNVIEKIKSDMDMVYLAGDGFSSNITIPERINNFEYDISITNGFLIINISGDIEDAMLMTNDISGTLSKGTNLVENNGGSLVIS